MTKTVDIIFSWNTVNFYKKIEITSPCELIKKVNTVIKAWTKRLTQKKKRKPQILYDFYVYKKNKIKKKAVKH